MSILRIQPARKQPPMCSACVHCKPDLFWRYAALIDVLLIFTAPFAWRDWKRQWKHAQCSSSELPLNRIWNALQQSGENRIDETVAMQLVAPSLRGKRKKNNKFYAHCSTARRFQDECGLEGRYFSPKLSLRMEARLLWHRTCLTIRSLPSWLSFAASRLRGRIRSCFSRNKGAL